jgi:excisionase family DNA binding protein
MEHIKEVLDRILEHQYLQKEVLSFEEACSYCGISKSKMYKHTSSNNIPYYKPEGKLIFFKKEELDEWLLRNRQSTKEEMDRVANTHSLNKTSNKSKMKSK